MSGAFLITPDRLSVQEGFPGREYGIYRERDADHLAQSVAHWPENQAQREDNAARAREACGGDVSGSVSHAASAMTYSRPDERAVEPAQTDQPAKQLTREVAAWETYRNANEARVDFQFTVPPSAGRRAAGPSQADHKSSRTRFSSLHSIAAK